MNSGEPPQAYNFTNLILYNMYRLCSEIKIGNVLFNSVNDVQIKRSINTLGATATIKVPVTAVVKQKDETQTTIETAQAIQPGTPVSIRLGYNDTRNDEFKGYVRQLNYKTPLEIECEDEFYTCRNKMVTLSGTLSLEQCLQKCGLSVRHATNLTLRNFAIDNKPVAKVLEKLKTDYKLCVFFDLQGQVVAGRATDIAGEEVKYELRYNIIKDDELKYNLNPEAKLKIKAICSKKDGTEVQAEAGNDGGLVKTLRFYDVESEAELKILAENELKRNSPDGYKGKITTFLLPFAEPCMLANVTDKIYSERNGRYYIESVETSYGTSGARRHVSLGIKI